MPLYKKLIIILSSSTFRILLFFTISIVAGVILYTDRNYVPSVIERNDVYARIIPSLLETNKEQSLTVGGDITLENPEIQKIIKDSIPPEELENYANTVLKSIYDWLSQESSSLNFTIDLSQNKQRLATGLSTYAVNRLQQLPVCDVQPTETDPFSATCQPKFIDYATEQLKLEKQILNESGILNDPVITEESLFGGDSEQSFQQNYRDVPTYYSLLKGAPIYLGLILLVLALIVIFTSSTKKKGILKIGRGLTGACISLVVFTVIFSFVLPPITGSLPILQSSGTGIDSLLNQVTVDFGQDYSILIIKITAPLIVIGAGMILYARSGKNKKDYKSAKLKSGLVSGNEQKTNKKTGKPSISRPPIQSSESSDTKPKKSLKNKKYRKIPKKEL